MFFFYKTVFNFLRVFCWFKYILNYKFGAIFHFKFSANLYLKSIIKHFAFFIKDSRNLFIQRIPRKTITFCANLIYFFQFQFSNYSKYRLLLKSCLILN